MNNPLHKLDRWLASRTLRRDLPLRGDTGVVSFSFDDAPRSACTTGRDVLERHGCHGTWYIAGGLTDQPEQGRMCHSAADVRDLARAGHHIGCHTFSHTPCDTLSGAQMREQLSRNAQYFEQLGLPSQDLHFSFPLGAYGLGSKRIAAQSFQSARITGGGIQAGQADLNALRSERLYDQVMTPGRLSALADEVAARRGWLIYYTHDVEDHPSQWGCTPTLLGVAVQAALTAGCKVLPVDQAIHHWQSQA